MEGAQARVPELKQKGSEGFLPKQAKNELAGDPGACGPQVMVVRRRVSHEE